MKKISLVAVATLCFVFGTSSCSTKSEANSKLDSINADTLYSEVDTSRYTGVKIESQKDIDSLDAICAYEDSIRLQCIEESYYQDDHDTL